MGVYRYLAMAQLRHGRVWGGGIYIAAMADIFCGGFI